ncbi:MAG: hypothetical protein HFJ94_04195 [Muribaculaceae bacterium]|nr:hypothetical protein [Muribaculaceae bacterium]
MTRLPVILLSLLVLAGAASCGSGSACADRIDTLRLAPTLLAGDESFHEPLGILASDSRLFVRNSVKCDTIIDEYATDGKYLRSFLVKGIAPGQMPYLTGWWYESEGNRLVVESDVARRKLLAVENLDSAEPQLRLIMSLRDRIVGAPDDSVVPASLMKLRNGAVLAPNLNKAGLLNAYDSAGRFVRTVVGYPEVLRQSGLPEYALANFFHLTGRVSPDGNHFAAAGALGDILCFGTADGDSVRITVVAGQPQKGIEVEAEDGSYSTFRYTDSLRYFHPGGVVVSDSHVYTIAGGLASEVNDRNKKMAAGEIEPLTEIRVHDYDGHLKKIIYIPVGRCLLAVRPDDSALYALEESNEYGYRLFQFEL